MPTTSPPGLTTNVAGKAVTRQAPGRPHVGIEEHGEGEAEVLDVGLEQARGAPRSTEIPTTTSPRAR